MNDDPTLPPAGDARPAPPHRYRVMQRVEGPVANLLGVSCREFARLTVTRLDRPLSASERMRHRLHGSICSVCTRFAAQFAALESLARDLEAEAVAPDRAAAPDAEAVERVKAAVRASVGER